VQGEDGSHLGSARLQDIECELGEQKKSTEKITKLCLAAIKVKRQELRSGNRSAAYKCRQALESLEKRSSGIDFKSSLDTVGSSGSLGSVGAIDPQIVKTICEQLDVINKMMIKVDDDIEGVDEKAESALADFEQLDR
jgi:hypothetical protein